MLWTQENPENGQSVHGFSVETPKCHTVPVSPAYTGAGGFAWEFAA